MTKPQPDYRDPDYRDKAAAWRAGFDEGSRAALAGCDPVHNDRGPLITALESGDGDDGGWNIGGSGLPSVFMVGNAVQCWALAQNRDVTVAEAARAFNVDEGVIRQAAEHHYWMEIGPTGVLEHEGE